MANTNEIIQLKSVKMNEEHMNQLESRGLIIRLFPDHHKLDTEEGLTENHCIYTASKKYGAHKLISVTVNRTALASFGSHPDNEEFLLIGNPNAKTMYLVLALCKKDELNSKIKSGNLKVSDFIALEVQYNDPYVSFFTVVKDVPHGECIKKENKQPATFYVTEPESMGIEKTDFGNYIIRIDENSQAI
jgi:hypothetical protein